MKLFDASILKQYHIVLLDKQIDIILNCISYYVYHEFNKNGYPKTEEENNKRSLLRDTYAQIRRVKISQRNESRRVIKARKKLFKKIS